MKQYKRYLIEVETNLDGFHELDNYLWDESNIKNYRMVSSSPIDEKEANRGWNILSGGYGWQSVESKPKEECKCECNSSGCYGGDGTCPSCGKKMDMPGGAGGSKPKKIETPKERIVVTKENDDIKIAFFPEMVSWIRQVTDALNGGK